MGRTSSKWRFALSAVFVAIAAFTSATSSARSDDEHDAKIKQAAAQSAKAANAFDEIMDAPEKGIPQDLLARARRQSRCSLGSSKGLFLLAARAAAVS